MKKYLEIMKIIMPILQLRKRGCNSCKYKKQLIRMLYSYEEAFLLVASYAYNHTYAIVESGLNVMIIELR